METSIDDNNIPWFSRLAVSASQKNDEPHFRFLVNMSRNNNYNYYYYYIASAVPAGIQFHKLKNFRRRFKIYKSFRNGRTVDKWRAGRLYQNYTTIEFKTGYRFAIVLSFVWVFFFPPLHLPLRVADLGRHLFVLDRVWRVFRLERFPIVRSGRRPRVAVVECRRERLIYRPS